MSNNPRSRDVEEELALHIALRVAELVAAGMDEPRARRQVLDEFGDLYATRRYCVRMDRRRDRRQTWGRGVWGVLDESRMAFRTLLRRPASAVAASGVLAAAITLNALVFSVVRGVLLAPLPIPGADRVVLLRERQQEHGQNAGVSYPAYREWRRQSRILQDVVAYLETTLPMTAEDGPVRVPGATVTEGFLSFTGARMIAGRGLLPAEHQAGGPRAVVIGEGLWKRHFGGDPRVVGRTITLDGSPYQIVGVAGGPTWPEDARFWISLEVHDPGFRDVWGARILTTLGRLRPGADPKATARELTAVTSAFPEGAGWEVRSTALADDLRDGVRSPLLFLQGAVVLVVLIACANVGILLMARGLSRRGEMAVRRALGASRARLAAGGLAEGMVVAGLAGTTGMALAWLLLGPALRLVPGTLPRASEVTMAPGVALFALGLALFSGLMAGVAPALAGARTGPTHVIREAGTHHSGSPWMRRVRSGMVVSQVALSVILLAGAGVLLRSFVAIIRQDPGFDPARVVAFDVSLPVYRYGDDAALLAFVDGLLERVENLPGVEAAAVGRNLPISGANMTSPVAIEGLEADREPVQVAWVSSGYFRVMGIPVLEGRAFDATDADGPPVAVVDEAFVRRFIPGASRWGCGLARSSRRSSVRSWGSWVRFDTAASLRSRRRCSTSISDRVLRTA